MHVDKKCARCGAPWREHQSLPFTTCPDCRHPDHVERHPTGPPTLRKDLDEILEDLDADVADEAINFDDIHAAYEDLGEGEV